MWPAAREKRSTYIAVNTNNKHEEMMLPINNSRSLFAVPPLFAVHGLLPRGRVGEAGSVRPGQPVERLLQAQPATKLIRRASYVSELRPIAGQCRSAELCHAQARSHLKTPAALDILTVVSPPRCFALRLRISQVSSVAARFASARLPSHSCPCFEPWPLYKSSR